MYTWKSYSTNTRKPLWGPGIIDKIGAAVAFTLVAAQVNFTGIALTGQDAGLHVLGFTSQAHFLSNCGIAHDLQAAGPRERSLGQRLINEHEMGELFKVVGFCHPDHPFEALGFESGDRSHRL
jgi:SAM-dependent MidA family methyltransferase